MSARGNLGKADCNNLNVLLALCPRVAGSGLLQAQGPKWWRWVLRPYTNEPPILLLPSPSMGLVPGCGHASQYHRPALRQNISHTPVCNVRYVKGVVLLWPRLVAAVDIMCGSRKHWKLQAVLIHMPSSGTLILSSSTMIKHHGVVDSFSNK